MTSTREPGDLASLILAMPTFEQVPLRREWVLQFDGLNARVVDGAGNFVGTVRVREVFDSEDDD